MIIIHDSYSRNLSPKELRQVNYALEGQHGGPKELSPEARITLALLLGKRGIDALSISRALDWKDFEALAAKACEEHGYQTTKNFRMRRPRVEIDVLAVSSDLEYALCIDCKHWARTAGNATMERVANSQIERATRFMSSPSLDTKPDFAIPVVTTLFDEGVTVPSRVPIVPIFRFSDFLLNLRGNLDEVKLIEGHSVKS